MQFDSIRYYAYINHTKAWMSDTIHFEEKREWLKQQTALAKTADGVFMAWLPLLPVEPKDSGSPCSFFLVSTLAIAFRFFYSAIWSCIYHIILDIMKSELSILIILIITIRKRKKYMFSSIDQKYHKNHNDLQSLYYFIVVKGLISTINFSLYQCHC